MNDMLKDTKDTLTSIRAFIKDIWVVLCMIGIVSSFFLALYGFYVSDLYKNKGTGWQDTIDLLYYTLQVFTFESPPEGAENVYVRVARFMGPVFVILLSVTAVISLFREQLGLLMVRLWYREHIVICGLGTKAMFLIGHFQSKRPKAKIVVIEMSDKNEHISGCKARGIAVIIGDASDEMILRKSSFQRASKVFVITGNDIENIAVTKLLLHDKRTKKKTDIYLHIHDYGLKEAIRKGEIIGLNERIHLFNIFEEVARRIVRDIPIDEGVTSVQPPFVVVIGFGSIGSAIVRQLIRMKVYPDGKRLCMWIIDKDAEQQERLFRARYYDPDDRSRLIFKNVDMTFISKDASLIFSISDMGIKQELLPDCIYICLGNDAETMRITQSLSDSIKKDKKIDKKVKIVSCYISDEINIEGCDKVEQGDAICKYAIKVKEDGCGSVLERDTIDRLARIIHAKFIVDNFIGDVEKYCKITPSQQDEFKSLTNFVEKENYIRKEYKSKMEKIIESKPSRKAWEELEESYKNSNRLQADHVSEKLRIINPSWTIDDADVTEIKEFISNNENKELLAKLEHKRWCHEQYVMGEKKIDYSYDFEALDETNKDRNRNIIEGIPLIVEEYQRNEVN